MVEDVVAGDWIRLTKALNTTKTSITPSISVLLIPNACSKMLLTTPNCRLERPLSQRELYYRCCLWLRLTWLAGQRREYIGHALQLGRLRDFIQCLSNH